MTMPVASGLPVWIPFFFMMMGELHPKNEDNRKLYDRPLLERKGKWEMIRRKGEAHR